MLLPSVGRVGRLGYFVFSRFLVKLCMLAPSLLSHLLALSLSLLSPCALSLSLLARFDGH